MKALIDLIYASASVAIAKLTRDLARLFKELTSPGPYEFDIRYISRILFCTLTFQYVQQYPSQLQNHKWVSQNAKPTLHSHQINIPDKSNPPTIKDTQPIGRLTVAELFSVLVPYTTICAFKQYIVFLASAEERESQTAVQGSGSS
jgi:hypothetical protein